MKRLKTSLSIWSVKVASLASQKSQSLASLCYVESAHCHAHRFMWPIILLWMIHLKAKVKHQCQKSQILEPSDMTMYPNIMSEAHAPRLHLDAFCLPTLEKFHAYLIPIIVYIFRDSESPTETISRRWLTFHQRKELEDRWSTFYLSTAQNCPRK